MQEATKNRRATGYRLAIACLLFPLATGVATAGEHGVGIRLGSYSADDEETEQTFDVDSGPIPEIFYRFQTDAHSVVVGLGFESWGRDEAGFQSELDFYPLTGSYRYHPWRDRAAAFFAGGGLSLNVYDATLETPGTLISETGALYALEPVVGVEFLPRSTVRIELAAKYSWQIISADELDIDLVFAEPLDVDMTGAHVTAAVSFMWGN